MQTPIITFLGIDYGSTKFELPPMIYKEFVKNLFFNMARYNVMEIHRGPTIDLSRFVSQNVVIMAVRSHGFTKNILTKNVVNDQCHTGLYTYSGLVTMGGTLFTLWNDTNLPGNRGSNYFYLFHNVRSNGDQVEFKFYPETNLNPSTLDESVIIEDAGCDTSNIKKLDYKKALDEVISEHIYKMGSKIIEDMRSMDINDVLKYVTQDNPCGNRQRANRCNNGRASVEFEVDDYNGNYTCMFAGSPSVNQFILTDGRDVPTTTTTTTTVAPNPDVLEAKTTTTTTTTTPAPTTTTKKNYKREFTREPIPKLKLDWLLKLLLITTGIVFFVFAMIFIIIITKTRRQRKDDDNKL